jgi:heptaprenyl diphosphate synthase
MNVNKNYVFFVALMTAFATSLFFFEVFLPKPLPFMKLGLSNIVVLVLVCSYFYKEAVIVATGKSLIGSFVTGTLLSPSFLLSFGGALLSSVVMIVFFRYIKGLSIVGVSVVGAFAHLVTQLFLVRLVIIHSDSVLSLYPVIALLSVITGFLTGLAGFYFMKYIDIRSYYAKTCG